MKAVCIDSSDSEVTRGNDILCQHAFYVSKFDNINSHTGAFQKDRFKVIEKKKQKKHLTTTPK